MKNLKTFLCLAGTAMLSFMAACSNGTDTAGVITETESGKTIAGLITDTEGKALARARVYLTGVDTVTYHTYVMDSAETADDGTFSMYSEGDRHHFRVLAKAAQKSDTLLGFEDYYNSTWDTGWPDTVHFEIEVGAPAVVQLYLQGGFGDIDSVCFHGTFVCAAPSKEELEDGRMTIRNMPAGQLGKYTVWRNDTAHTSPFVDDPKSVRPGDTLYWSGIVALWGSSVETLNITIPEKAKAILDSAGLEPTLNNLIVPVFAPKDKEFNMFIDGWGSNVDLFTAEKDKSTEKYWATFDTVNAKEQEAHWLMTQYEYPHKPYNNIRLLYSEIEAGTTFFDTNFVLQTPSFAVSFWIEKDGEAADSSDGANSRIEIFSAGTDTLGFEIAQCEKDAQFICTTIRNGIDSAATDSTIYGKAKVLDGNRHHVSLAIHEKHLAIAIDGITIRDTDLKLAENFARDLRHIQVGDERLEDFIVYHFDKSIRKEGDKDWDRLKAWLMAFYEMQNLLY
ncbi:MAG: carboxypeptidase regulatory-like domain-containing protein [Fibrobacter sp.]|nr:carboxypeptidase regulatory-like domain-containing protein [Fibrobacter sp.]